MVCGDEVMNYSQIERNYQQKFVELYEIENKDRLDVIVKTIKHLRRKLARYLKHVVRQLK
jgi:ribosomal protein S17E